MPLIKGFSKKSISENIKKEMELGKPHEQAIAIAMETARNAKAESKGFGGAIHPESIVKAIKMKKHLAHGGLVEDPKFGDELRGAMAEKEGYPVAGKILKTGTDVPYSEKSKEKEMDKFYKTTNFGGGKTPHFAHGGMVESEDEEFLSADMESPIEEAQESDKVESQEEMKRRILQKAMKRI